MALICIKEMSGLARHPRDKVYAASVASSIGSTIEHRGFSAARHANVAVVSNFAPAWGFLHLATRPGVRRRATSIRGGARGRWLRSRAMLLAITQNLRE